MLFRDAPWVDPDSSGPTQHSLRFQSPRTRQIFIEDRVSVDTRIAMNNDGSAGRKGRSSRSQVSFFTSGKVVAGSIETEDRMPGHKNGISVVTFGARADSRHTASTLDHRTRRGKCARDMPDAGNDSICSPVGFSFCSVLWMADG
jgi:hypothetical protein